MKKYFILLMGILLLLTGCGKKVVKSSMSCVKELQDSKSRIITTIIVNFENDEAKSVSNTLEYDNTAIASEYCPQFQNQYTADEITCIGRKIIINDYYKTLWDITEGKITKNGLTSYFKSEGYICDTK